VQLGFRGPTAKVEQVRKGPLEVIPLASRRNERKLFGALAV
jgi:hypothetical protein